MKLLHIMTDGPAELPERIIEAQSADNEVEIVDLSHGDISYDAVIDAIFSCDRVISW
ncbi:MAG: hypothetical protein OEN55_06520 [Alphaproteobacteria bacterium]|nr:hypothetical protein [Alphaproteobacteria bacterium]